MIRKIAIALASTLAISCASMPQPQPTVEKKEKIVTIVKEISVPHCIMSQVPVSGSPCLDALRFYMNKAGCKKVETTGDQFDGPVLIRCISGKVTGPFSKVFIMVPFGVRIDHPQMRTWCVDNVMAISNGNIIIPGSIKRGDNK